MSNFKIIKDSCVNQKVDAIVNAANGHMMHGGGVARAILMKAGPELNDACHKYKLPPILSGNLSPSALVKLFKYKAPPILTPDKSKPSALVKLFKYKAPPILTPDKSKPSALVKPLKSKSPLNSLLYLNTKL